MAKKKKVHKPQPSNGQDINSPRAYRISTETHLKLKELAKADDRKIGSELTGLINKAHAAYLATLQST